MAKFQAPRSDRDRLAFLKRTAITGPQDIASGDSYVSQDTLDRINAFLPGFEAAVDAVSEKLGARSKEVRERAAAMERVSLYTRDLWAVLNRRVNRQRCWHSTNCPWTVRFPNRPARSNG